MLTQLLFYIIIALKGIRSLYFWQLKEYRIDRFTDFIKNEQGYDRYFSLVGLVSYLLIFLNLFLQNTSLLQAALVISLIDVVYLNLFQQRLRFKPTSKALLIYSLFLILVTIFNFTLGLSAAYILSGLCLFFSVALFTPITYFAKESKIQKAKLKIQQFPNLKIIGITGSYGKSSTKEFLSEVLSNEFTVLKTPKNINTEIGIANLILSKLTAKHQILVIEIGAYRINEIARTLKMFELDFSIITAIADQHLSLFGSLENIQIAKSEIASTLKKTGKLFLNIDSEGVQKVAAKLAKKHSVITYGNSSTADVKIENITQSDKLSFEINSTQFVSNVFGEHNAVNIAVVFAVCQELGIPVNKIKSYVAKLSTLDTSLAKKVGYNGCIVLDDSYNSNPEGFLAAISMAKKIKAKKKILITRGMLELGANSDMQHNKVAIHSEKVFNTVLITNPSLKSYFKKNTVFIPYNQPDLIISQLSDILDSDTLVLIENRLSSKAYKFLLPKS